jgi:hypothetical protein
MNQVFLHEKLFTCTQTCDAFLILPVATSLKPFFNSFEGLIILDLFHDFAYSGKPFLLAPFAATFKHLQVFEIL